MDWQAVQLSIPHSNQPLPTSQAEKHLIQNHPKFRACTKPALEGYSLCENSAGKIFAIFFVNSKKNFKQQEYLRARIGLAKLLVVATILSGCATTTPEQTFKEVQAADFGSKDPSLIYRVILIGDAGAIGANEHHSMGWFGRFESETMEPEGSPRKDHVTSSLGRWGDHYSNKTWVVFLGDNVYPNGLAFSPAPSASVFKSPKIFSGNPSFPLT